MRLFGDGLLPTMTQIAVGNIHDAIFIFQKGDSRTWNTVFQAPSAEYIKQFFDQ